MKRTKSVFGNNLYWILNCGNIQHFHENLFYFVSDWTSTLLIDIAAVDEHTDPHTIAHQHSETAPPW